MAESVSESIAATFADLSSGEESGASAEPAGAPQAEPAAEPEPAGDSVRDALEKGMTEIETGAADREALDEIFKPLTGKMAAAKLTRADVARQAITTLERLHTDPAGSLGELASHLRTQGASPLQIVEHVARTLGLPVGPQQPASAGHADQQAAAADAQIQAFAATRPDFAPVREAMGKLMQEAAERGERMDMQRAYEVATRQGKQPPVARPRQAAAAPGQPADTSVRALLEAAAKELGLVA